jgi:DNA repair protein RecN (Recombination protein N)
MLTALSIRDIVLIEKLDVSLDKGLTILTGETGAGKSILLDALGLALGARGDSSLVRSGAAKGVVTAAYALPKTHAAHRIWRSRYEAATIPANRERRWPSGAINDQPVSLNLRGRLQTLAEPWRHDDRRSSMSPFTGGS